MPLNELISPILMGACAATGAASAVRSRRVPSVAETRSRLMASLPMVRVTVGPKHGEVKRRTDDALRGCGAGGGGRRPLRRDADGEPRGAPSPGAQGGAPSALPTVPTTAPRASRTSATQVSISAQPPAFFRNVVR